jgi:hypothetical protein
MKINRLETHDRLLHFKKDQEANINQGLEDCLKKNPFSLALQQRSPYIYIFAHPRTDDDGFTKRMIWQPRLSKPTPQTNSYLFRVESHTDNVEICWLLPPREMWGQYKKGNVTENEIVLWSISEFTNNREKLAEPFPDDFSEERIKSVLIQIAREMEEDARMKKLYIKPMNEEFSSI